MPSAASRSANLHGTLWMIAAMAAFAIEDALVKLVSASLPTAQILTFFGLGGAFVFALITLSQHEPLYTPDALSPPMRLRGGI